MIKNTIIAATIISLISGAVSAKNDIVLSENNSDQILAILAPLAIGALGLMLSQGHEPEAAKKSVVDTIKQDVLTAAAAGNSLSNDIRLNESSTSYALSPFDVSKIRESMSKVSEIADKALPRLKELIDRKMPVEKADDRVTEELSGTISDEIVKEAASADVKN